MIDKDKIVVGESVYFIPNNHNTGTKVRVVRVLNEHVALLEDISNNKKRIKSPFVFPFAFMFDNREDAILDDNEFERYLKRLEAKKARENKRKDN